MAVITPKDEAVAQCPPMASSNPMALSRLPSSGKYLVYVVFVGYPIGFAYHPDTVKAMTDGYRGQRSKGYKTMREAYAAWDAEYPGKPIDHYHVVGGPALPYAPEYAEIQHASPTLPPAYHGINFGVFTAPDEPLQPNPVPQVAPDAQTNASAEVASASPAVTNATSTTAPNPGTSNPGPLPGEAFFLANLNANMIPGEEFFIPNANTIIPMPDSPDLAPAPHPAERLENDGPIVPHYAILVGDRPGVYRKYRHAIAALGVKEGCLARVHLSEAGADKEFREWFMAGQVLSLMQ
ncbi:hypothetical protein BD410DRAFT_809871 [Rickenella mellea]|uniref:Uncharacterized protein n=1 Tax=Rickenella mellea TaxID=50990 RepID=A0A4Y7PGV7_9AGAM|nr:hypothetical protein BD410DRAFT_809871 [Rickenella mellea]